MNTNNDAAFCPVICTSYRPHHHSIVVMANKEEPLCADCEQTSARTNDLACGRHIICTRAQSKQNVLNCQKCGSSRKKPGVWIFVDNSNLWIEAKKLQGRKRYFESTEDPRVRIDVGKLAEIIADGRPIVQANIYGSIPPPVDTVWAKMEEAGWNVNIKERSPITGREKQVDQQITADVTAIVTETGISEGTPLS